MWEPNRNPSLTSSQYEAFLSCLSTVGFNLLATVEEGLNTGLTVLYILAAPLTVVRKGDDVHSIQTAKTLDLIFVLTCWNDSSRQEGSVKSLRPTEITKNNDDYKHLGQTQLTEAGGDVHNSWGSFFACGFGFTFPFWNKTQRSSVVNFTNMSAAEGSYLFNTKTEVKCCSGKGIFQFLQNCSVKYTYFVWMFCMN